MTEPIAASLESTPPAAKPAALWEDFVDVFTQPASVFARRRDGRFGKALLILSVIAGLVFLGVRPLMQPLFDRQFELQVEQMRKNPNMSAEQLEAAKRSMEKIGSIGITASAIVGTPLLVLVSAALVWGMARAAGVPVTYGQTAMVTTYANVPRVLSSVATGLVLLVRDPSSFPVGSTSLAGPALLLPSDASPYLAALAGRFDLFTIWVTVLVGIGVATVGKTSRAKGFTVAGLVWVLATLFALFGAMRQAAQMAG